MKFGTLIQFNECYSMLKFLRCCGAVCTYIARARWESSDFEIGTLFRDMEMGTQITFLCMCIMHMHRHFYFQQTLSSGREIWYTDTVQ